MNLRRRKSTRARIADSVGKKFKRSGPARIAQGAGGVGQAAGKGGKAIAVYTGRKASGKRAPLLVSLPVFAGASFAGFIAVRRLRRGAKQTAPGR